MSEKSINVTSQFTCPYRTLLNPGLLLQRSDVYDDFLLAFIIINCGISILATFSNFTVIYTISRTSLLQTPSYILILGLSIADLGVGLVTQPAFYLRGIFKLQNQFELFCGAAIIYDNSIWIFPAMSFLNLTATIVDRFLAVHLHLRYRQLITVKRCFLALTVVLLADCVLIVLKIVLEVLAFFAVIFVFLLTFLIMNAYFVYKIYQVIRRHSLQIHAQQQSVQQSIDMPRYKKSVNTMYYMIGAFGLCYLPYVFGLIVLYVVGEWTLETNFLFTVTITLMMSNGILNPIIYFWRIKEIRNAAFSRFFKTNNVQ